MVTIKLNISCNIPTPGDRPYLEQRIEVDHFENIENHEMYILDKLVPALNKIIKEYEDSF